MRHFNMMAKNLKENQERMIYLEKMAAWQEIARRLAHEIKNPLTPIRLTIQQIVDSDPHSNEEFSKLLNESYQIINEEIGSLHRLVTEFSEFGKMPELNLQKDDLRALIKDVATLYSHRQIQLQLPGNPVEVPFDWDRMKRVFINLLENAVQADPENRPIVITLIKNSGEIQIEVKDNGPGIAEEMLPRIFEPYFSTKKSGVGLGLAITRKMVEEHGGRISVDAAPGQGTCFTIVLPKA
ncbi:MAG: PAS domain-containing sensor histidine kinase [Calditrichia bacterium]